MANVILDICLEANSDNVQITFRGRTGIDPPAPSGPFYYRVFWSQADTPDHVEGTTVELGTTGTARVIVYDAQPGDAPASWYESPTFIDDRMIVEVSGTFQLRSGSERNPWPPT